MNESQASAVADANREAERVVLDLCAEYRCVPGGDWQRLAERAYLQGRIAGLEWAREKIKP